MGLDLTGTMAEVYMSWWDRELILLLREDGICVVFYIRYVDDSNMILKAGTNSAEEETTVEPQDKQIMERVRAKANTIHENIKATCDYGSNYNDGKLPMLDIKIWIGESTDGRTRVLHEHFMKDVSSRYLLSYRSAHPESMKINVLVNEALRIMRNCSKFLKEEVVRGHLQYFVNRMQYSGYPVEYRYEVLTRAFKIREQQMALEDSGDTVSRRKSKRSWYDEDKYEGVMFVEVTPNSELKQRVQKACRKNNLKINVVEKMNRSVKTTLQRSNPFGWQSCGRPDCPTCNRDIKINCRARGCVYQIECVECKESVVKMYRGQTGRSIYERMKEHISKWSEEAEDSCLHAHSTEKHRGEQFRIDVKLLKQCYGKPTERMISEAVLIQDLPSKHSLNSKAEWSYVKLPKVTVS